jgi:heme/copper-type cytochrome/quinol oxidase subunit 3
LCVREEKGEEEEEEVRKEFITHETNLVSPSGHKKKITSHQSNLGFSILLLVSLLIFFLLLAVFFSVSFISKYEK